MAMWFIIWGVSSFILGGIFGIVVAFGWPELFEWAFPRDRDEEKPEIVMTTYEDHNHE
jgi:hypothetical protein